MIPASLFPCNSSVLLGGSSIPFDPKDCASQFSDENPEKNIGIRLVMNLAHDVTYQNLLGLNVLTIRFPVLNQ